MNIFYRTLTALRIEFHWWCIRCLRCRPQTEKISRRIRFHRYLAGQLSDLYEILCGIRDFDRRVIG